MWARLVVSTLRVHLRPISRTRFVVHTLRFAPCPTLYVPSLFYVCTFLTLFPARCLQCFRRLRRLDVWASIHAVSCAAGAWRRTHLVGYDTILFEPHMSLTRHCNCPSTNVSPQRVPWRYWYAVGRTFPPPLPRDRSGNGVRATTRCWSNETNIFLDGVLNFVQRSSCSRSRAVWAHKLRNSEQTGREWPATRWLSAVSMC